MTGCSHSEACDEINKIVPVVDKLYHDIIDAKVTQSTDKVGTVASVYLFLFKMCIPKNNKKGVILAETVVTRSLNLLRGKEHEPRFIAIAMETYYNAGVLHNMKDRPKLSLCAHDKAFRLYLNYAKNKKINTSRILSYVDIGANIKMTDVLDELAISNLDKLLVLCTNPITHIPTEQISVRINEIITCLYKMLNEKLSNLPTCINRYDKWMKILVMLSDYFAQHNCFTEARDWLAINEFVRNKYYMYVKVREQEYPAEQFMLTELYQNLSLNAALCWIDYGIQLLQSSRERMLCGTDGLCAVCNLKSLSVVTPADKLQVPADMKSNLEEFKSMITDKHLSSCSEALSVFEIVVKHLVTAKDLYIAKKKPKLYLTIVLKYSQVYKLFTFYVSNINKLKLLEQRVVILKTALCLLRYNPDVCRLLYLELLVAFNDVLDMVTEHSRNQLNKEKSTEIIAINKAAENIVQMCNMYFESFK